MSQSVNLFSEKKSLLVTLDIESLYSNIVTEFGLQAAKVTLEKT